MKRIILIIFSFIIWLLLTWTFNWQSLVTGMVVSLTVGLMFGNLFVSNAKKVLMLAASEGDTAAAKKLLDYSKKPAETKRGRFVKDEARKEAAKKVRDDDILSDAALRLNVVSIRD